MLLPATTMKELLEAGVHFGHPTRRWNPKMKKFIYGARNGTYILDLHQTLERVEEAYQFVRQLTANGGKLLLVGTKRQAQESIKWAAQTSGMYYVNYRWPGGMLTNFRTIRSRIDRLRELEKEIAGGLLETLPKNEAKRLQETYAKLERMLGGVKDMESLPDALFIVDLRKERLAVEEARRLGIPTVAMVDTDRDPELVTYPIPSNDDAIRAIRLMSGIIAEAVKEGLSEWAAAHPEQVEAAPQPPLAPAAPVAAEVEAPGPESVAAEAALPVTAGPQESPEQAPPEIPTPPRKPRTFRKQLAPEDEEALFEEETGLQWR